MHEYFMYNFTIKEADLLRVLHDAASHGCQPTVLINGMYYSLELDNVQPASDDDLF